MQKHIHNPYKVNWKMYGLIGGISILVMIVAVVQNNTSHDLISDIVKNLAFGCVASTLVALLIEIGNVKEKNEKSNSIYDSIYRDLKCQILWYVETWASLCAIAYKDKDYSKERHTWTEWYSITKNNFAECDESRQKQLMHFFTNQLMICIEGIEQALRQIDSQHYILNINEIYNDELEKIFRDYRFEFDAAKMTLTTDPTKNDFWSTFDAITQDLSRYIYNWVDIRYYNYYKFKFHEFSLDKTELIRATLESEKATDNIVQQSL